LPRPLPFLAALGVVLLAGCVSPPPASSAPGARSGPSAEAPVAASTRMKPDDVRDILDHHNAVRAAVGVAPLRWDAGLASYAQQWADRMAADGCRMKHREPNVYGENLYQGTLGHYTAVDAARAWAREKRFYDGGVFTKNDSAQAGHYTQMVWRDTARIGCGEATCSGSLLVACNYDPPGNYLGRKPY
jgi:pathogenesis-related protein 1